MPQTGLVKDMKWTALKAGYNGEVNKKMETNVPGLPEAGDWRRRSLAPWSLPSAADGAMATVASGAM